MAYTNKCKITFSLKHTKFIFIITYKPMTEPHPHLHKHTCARDS